MNLTPRVIAICLCRDGDRILCFEARDEVRDQTFYRPLGGGVEPGETPVDAVRREMLEELGATIEDVRLLGVLDNSFEWRGRPRREIVHVFDATLSDATLYGRDDLVCNDGDDTWPARWMRLGDFEPDGAPPLYPDGLLEVIRTHP